MPRFPSMGVSAVVDGYQDYIKKVGTMATATEQSHSRIGALGRATFGGLLKGAGLAAGAIVGIGVAAGGAIGAVGALAAKLAIDASPLVDMEKGFNAIAENAGLVGSEVLKAMQDVTAGTIRAADLMQLFNKGTTLLGENFQDIVPIMDQIIAQGAAIGLEPLQAVQDFTTGVARESKMILDNLGIIVNLEDATTAYAKTLGKTADELTAVQRQSAILNAAQKSLEKTSKALPSLNDFASTSLNRMKVTMQETKDEIGKTLVPALKELIDSFQGALGPEAKNIVEIFKKDFVPTLTEIAQFIGANLPKAIKFGREAFIFFGRVIREMWAFMTKFFIPGFNWLYRVFVDDVLPIIQKVGKFFGGLFNTLFGGITDTDSLRDALLGLIPPAVLDFIEGLKTKWGEWVTIAKEWWTIHGPDIIQGFTDIKDFIVNDFIPNALEFLATSTEPLVTSFGLLWASMIDKKPDVLAAWAEIKREAEETFSKSIPEWLTNLQGIWEGLVFIWSFDIGVLTGKFSEFGSGIIETIGDIITLGLDLLNIALSTAIQLMSALVGFGVAIRTGDWDTFLDLITTLGSQNMSNIGDFGEGIMDLLNLPGGPHQRPALPAPATVGGGGRLHGEAQNTPAPQSVVPFSGGGRLHGEAQNTQNFSLTVNTSAPVEPIVSDFHQMAAMARGPQKR